jgi:hypothetical protein
MIERMERVNLAERNVHKGLKDPKGHFYWGVELSFDEVDYATVSSFQYFYQTIFPNILVLSFH